MRPTWRYLIVSIACTTALAMLHVLPGGLPWALATLGIWAVLAAMDSGPRCPVCAKSYPTWWDTSMIAVHRDTHKGEATR